MKHSIKRILSVWLVMMMALTILPAGFLPVTASPSVYYEHLLSTVPTEGDNTLGSLTWNFSMAGNGSIETGSSGRGARFAVADNDPQELVVKTSITGVDITRIVIDAGMGGGSDTTLSVSVGGVDVGTDVPLSNTVNSYTFSADNLNGEVAVKLKATVSGKQSYLKAITIYTGEFVKTSKVNYHGHTYRCNHAGDSTDEQYVQAAINNDFTVMGFSDHVMLPWITYENSVRGTYWQSKEYYRAIRALQEKYEGQIDIVLGYEAEWAMGGLFEDYYRYLIDNSLVDYLIFGNHWQKFDTDSNRFITQIEDAEHELENVRNYVTAALEALDSGLFTVMAHPEIFFVKGYGNVQSFTPEMQALVKQMCKKAKEKGVALELNHGYVNNMETRACYTDFWNIVKEVGNTVVIGVDAHYPGAYNESVRQRIIKFADKIGLTITEDLGVTKKTPKNVPLYLLEGQVEPTDASFVAEAKKTLTWGNFRGLNTSENAVAFDLSLPEKIKDCTLTWSSDNTAVISDTGHVTRPEADTAVTMTATIALGEASDTKEFPLTVLSSDKTPELFVPDFLEYPTAWVSNTVTAKTQDGKVVFTAPAGNSYQNTKLTLSEAFIVPQSIWDDTYLEYDFTVPSEKVQITMSYTSKANNTAIVNLGQLMDGDTSSNADHYHGSAKGRLSIQEIVDYINTQPDAGWGKIDKITGDQFYIKDITLWFSSPNSSVHFDTFRVVYEEDTPQPTAHTLSVTAGEGGTVRIGDGTPGLSAAQTAVSGTDVTVTAEANENYVFDGWFENGAKISSGSVFTFSLTSDRTLEARFKAAGGNTDNTTGSDNTTGFDNTTRSDNTTGADTPLPDTGDSHNLNLILCMGIASLAVIGGLTVTSRKQRDESHYSA